MEHGKAVNARERYYFAEEEVQHGLKRMQNIIHG